MNSSLFDVVALIIGVLWLLKKIVNMDRFFNLRVILLATILSAIMLGLFSYFLNSPNDSDCPDCDYIEY